MKNKEPIAQPSEDMSTAETFGLISIIFSSVGAVLALFSTILGYLGGGIGLGLAIIGIKRNKKSIKSKIGLAISILALVLSLVSTVIGIVIIIKAIQNI